jgi:hypothetical protein
MWKYFAVFAAGVAAGVAAVFSLEDEDRDKFESGIKDAANAVKDSVVKKASILDEARTPEDGFSPDGVKTPEGGFMRVGARPPDRTLP